MAVKIDRKKVRVMMALRGIDTQRELAEMANVHPQTVGYVMNGQPFSSETLHALADALECNPIDLISTEGYPAPHMGAPAFAGVQS